MKQYLKRWALPLSVVVVSLMAAPAHAAFETATFSTVIPGEVVSISYTDNTTGKTMTESGWAGAYIFNPSSDNTGPLTNTFSGFCIDVSQDINSGQKVYFGGANLANAPNDGGSSSSAMGSTAANLIAQLWAADYSLIGTDNTKAAAFQIAIWEIVNGPYSTETNVSNFSVTADTATMQYVTNWLSGLDYNAAENGTGKMTNGLYALTDPTYQDYVVQLPAPAPPGLILGLIGGVSFLVPSVWRWRKRASVPLAQ